MMKSVTALRPDSFWSGLALHKVPPRFLLVAAMVPYVILAISYLQAVPAWLAFGLAFIPWLLIVFVELIDLAVTNVGRHLFNGRLAGACLTKSAVRPRKALKNCQFGVPHQSSLAVAARDDAGKGQQIDHMEFARPEA